MTQPVHGHRGHARSDQRHDESDNVRRLAQSPQVRPPTRPPARRPAVKVASRPAAQPRPQTQTQTQTQPTNNARSLAQRQALAANSAEANFTRSTPARMCPANLESVVQSPGFKAVISQATTAGLYRQPTPNNQDAQNNVVAGLGGKFIETMPVTVFSPRRQTDQMVRQAYALLPGDLKRDVAFVSATRVAQDPEGAARQMMGKKEVVIVGSFKGVNSATKDEAAFTTVHTQEMQALDLSLKLANTMGVKVRDVVFAMGDSSPVKSGGQFVANDFARTKREELEARMNTTLQVNGVGTQKSLSWGADDLMVTAFAAQLPNKTLAAHIQNPNARSFYDASATTSSLVEQAAKKVGLTVVPSGQRADMQLRAFTLENAANTAGDQTFPDARELPVQQASDQKFARAIKDLDASALARTVVVDARLSNGAMDTTSLPPTTGVLGYGAWGTTGNNFSQSLAMAKIVAAAQDCARCSGDPNAKNFVDQARRQLVVEAVAHDALFIGYANGASGATLTQTPSNPLANWMREQKLPTSPGSKLTESQLVSLHTTASRYATTVLHNKYPELQGNIQFVPSPYNRRFEANTLYSEGVLKEPGSVSSELVSRHPEFDPGRTYRDWRPAPAVAGPQVGSNGRF